MDPSAETLLNQIRLKRSEVDRFLAAAQPRKRRLLNLVIIGGTLSAALTGAPAIGGTTLTAWLTETFGLTSPAWQILCAAASISSIAVTVATQLLKSGQVEQNVANAQRSRARLEVLETGLASGHLESGQALNEYMKCVEDVAFIG